MNKTNQILKEAIELIKSGKSEKASSLIYNCDLKKQTTEYLIKRGWNNEEAIDFFHDGLMQFLENVNKKKIRNEDNLGGYFFQICKNLSLLGYRITKLLEDEKIKLEKEYPEIASLCTDDEFDLRNYAKKGINAYFALGKTCREIMKMKYVWDYSHKQIAKELNYANAVSSRNVLSQCLGDLLKKLGDMPAKLSYEDLENLRKSLENKNE